MEASKAVTRAAVRPQAQALTAADRSALAKHGRPGLLKRLRVQVTVAWSAVASTLVVGFPMMMSEDYAVSDSGILISMMAMPAMVVAAHGQARMQRVRANDPNRVVAPITVAAAPDLPELQELAQLRGRLEDLVEAIQDTYPDVAGAMRAADEKAHRSLIQQARALATLAQAQDAATVAARDEIQSRLQAGLGEYQHLIAQCALLLARSDAHMNVDTPLRSAADLAATYSEGIRVSEDSGQ